MLKFRLLGFGLGDGFCRFGVGFRSLYFCLFLDVVVVWGIIFRIIDVGDNWLGVQRVDGVSFVGVFRVICFGVGDCGGF